MSETKGRQNGRRGRVHLDRELIMDAATELAAQGVPITFRALGTTLHADPTAVYRHFRDKDELVHAVYDRMLSQMVTQVDTAAPWKDQIRQGAHLTWDVCEKYPSIGVESLNLTTGGPGELAAVELLLEQALRSGLDQDQAVQFYAVVAAYVLSVGGALATTRMKATADGSWLRDLGRADPQHFPRIAAARNELADLTNRDIVEAGLDVLLDSAGTTSRA